MKKSDQRGRGREYRQKSGKGRELFKGHILYRKNSWVICVKCYHYKSFSVYSERNKGPRNLTLKAFKVRKVSSDCLKVHAEPFWRVRKEKGSFDRINSALTINTLNFKRFVVVVVVVKSCLIRWDSSLVCLRKHHAVSQHTELLVVDLFEVHKGTLYYIRPTLVFTNCFNPLIILLWVKWVSWMACAICISSLLLSQG